jgi:hypothetical protein
MVNYTEKVVVVRFSGSYKLPGQLITRGYI